jgi:streptomycin 6-kinase
MKLLDPFELSYNYVAPVLSDEGYPLVLKLSFPGNECVQEIETLKFYSGIGMCKLIASIPEMGALLIERLHPGKSLETGIGEKASIEIFCGVIKEMMGVLRRPPPSFPDLSALVIDFQKLKENADLLAEAIPSILIEKAELLFHNMLATQKIVYLLHGDLHQRNILSSGIGWKAIDPKGVIGEAEYELIPFLTNCITGDVDSTIERRIELVKKELHVDIERVYTWGFCRSVLAAWWNVEDNVGLSQADLDAISTFSKKILY